MYKILMIDDDLEVLGVNQKFFEEKDCVVEVCSEPSKALSLVESFKPHCIFLDVMMPEVDGFSLCREVLFHWKKHQSGRHCSLFLQVCHFA